MSAKWRRAKRWDDENIPSWAWPVKFVLRAFSSITLAVCLLSFVVVYATLASVPIGLLALVPTYFIYLLTFLVGLAVVAILPSVGLWKVLRGADRGIRFAVPVLAGIVLTPVTSWLWLRFAWPHLLYDPASGEGLRLFAAFVDRYDATTLRRLPGFEMTELEFYGWWPLRFVLLAFVANMVIATVRRIEFAFVNLGVLTVHTGIVVMALGSIYYTNLKREGVAILRSGYTVRDLEALGQSFRADPSMAEDFEPRVGPPTSVYYDNIDVALFIAQEKGWEQRPVVGLPRYNDYNLDALSPNPDDDSLGPINARTRTPPNGSNRVDPDLDFRIVGYASYAEPVSEWVALDAPSPDPATPPGPFRLVHLDAATPEANGELGPSKTVFTFPLFPNSPAQRIRLVPNAAIGVEYTLDMPDERFRDLTEPLPSGTRHALVVEIPAEGEGEPFRSVYPVTAGRTIRVAETGYTIRVDQLAEEPPFPLITEGYRGASSSLAVVEITTPEGEQYDRWIYHRFPEISQDFLDNPDGGRPIRRDADPAIDVRYIDANILQLYLDERSDGTVRSVVRLPSADVIVTESLGPDLALESFLPRDNPAVQPKVDLVIARQSPHARRIERPDPVPAEEQDRQIVGSHEMSMAAVQVSAPDHSHVVWVPFTPYPLSNFGREDQIREVTLPDGRRIRLMIGRKQLPFREFALQLVDFEMLAYDHRGAPRDYQSTVRVVPAEDADFEGYTHVAKLNAPLKAPFMWDDDKRSLLANWVGRVTSGLDPNQYKLSQARWDAGTWQATQELTDRGEFPRPIVQWTVLGVGNNPGIHVIAFGSVLMALGIPWAFYVKPAILSHRKRKIQAQVAAGTYTPPSKHREAGEPARINGGANMGAASPDSESKVGAES